MRDKKDRPENDKDREASSWVDFLTEVRYARLGARDWHEQLPAAALEKAKALQKEGQLSLFLPGPGKAALADLPPTYWLDVRRALSERLLRGVNKQTQLMGVAGTDTGPGVPGTNNWVPIGPSVVRHGQASGNPPVAGRTNGIAIASGGNRVYVSTADGGVWRSDDAGASWRSTMDVFDVDPTAFAATSNACGAVAIDPADPNRVYVGTGEGDTNELFMSRVVTALPTYRGVGPIRSDNGGDTWNAESAAPSSPTLVGSAFFALAVDPGDRENVVAATNVGLYRREPDGAGAYHWVQKRTGIHTSVIACRTGTTTTFYAAPHGGGVFSSTDGNTWAAVGTGFPASGRITLAARPTDPNVLYAFVASGDTFVGVFRLDGGTGVWKTVSGLPALGGQASYNLPATVDPNDANTIYIAGSSFGGDGSIYRCAITSSAGNYSMTPTFIGTGVHSDVHVLVHAPGDSSTLWVGCDGGVFRTTSATGAATFTHRNTGLATLCTNFFSEHPTQLSVAVVGLQDNGTARYTGEEVWTHVRYGDGGYPLINWADPNKVLVYQNGSVYRATDGGQAESSFSNVLSPAWRIMAEPLVGTPYKPSIPTDADTVAFGAGTQLFISTDFGATWGSAIATLSQNIFALAFASATRLYVGTTLGQVHRFDKSGATWNSTRIDNVAAGALPISGLITDIEVDPADATGASIYITFGGAGDRRHVWHFDGTSWQDRSGPTATGLIDVEHNAIVADTLNTSTLYVGSDVGVSQSTNGGATWTPMENGLPDAAVLDLQIHPTGRLLRAATHGRGMFEYKLDPPSQADVEIYTRDTSLDVGRASTADGLGDPETWPTQPVLHYLSRNIKVDVPTSAGYQTPTNSIDFLVFNDVIIDGSWHTATIDPATGTVVNRVYVEVHNRGVVPAASVQVMLLLANASAGLPPLPSGYQNNVISGTPISTATWQTVGKYSIMNLRAGFPQIAPFSLPSTMLPPPASLPGQSHYCLLALLHSAQDGFTSTQTNADLLTIADRKVAQRNIEIVAFVGTPPPPGNGIWARVDLYGSLERHMREIIIDSRSFQGRLGLVLPANLQYGELIGLHEYKNDVITPWVEEHTQKLRTFMKNGRYSYDGCRQMLSDIRRAVDRRMLMAERGKRKGLAINGIILEPGKRYPLFFYLEPEGLKSDHSSLIHVIQRDAETKNVEGGCTYRFVLTPYKERTGKQDR